MSIKSLISRLALKMRVFLYAEGGMTLPVTALSMVVATGLTGVAIDMGRLQMVQSKLQFSLDAAGLAAGSTVSTASLNSEVAKYLNGNFNGYMGATLTGSGVTATNNNTQFNLSATATMPTTFLSVMGVKTMTTTANSQISRAITGLELVLVLDNTGSMTDPAGGGVSKISALQTAANTLITTLFQSNPPAGKLWIGIVPFSQAVNIGTSHPTWMDTTYDATISGMPLTQGPGWGSSSWVGCVDARQNGLDVTDDPPTGSGLLQQYYWPSDNLNYGSPFNNIPNSFYSTAAQTNYSSGYAWAKVSSFHKCVTSHGVTTCSNVSSCTASGSTTCTPLSYAYRYSPMTTSTPGPNYLCPQEVTPMTNTQSTLTSAINAMVAQGNTVINEGMAWGWRMLSPRWQGYWGGTMNANGLPLAYGTSGMIKAVVLLTDGENTIDNASHSSYWYASNGRTGATTSTAAEAKLDSKTLAICQSMKANNIYVYTIGLGSTGINTSLLQSCATAVNYAFTSPTTSQLQTIFSQIGDSLSNLRVSH